MAEGILRPTIAEPYAKWSARLAAATPGPTKHEAAKLLADYLAKEWAKLRSRRLLLAGLVLVLPGARALLLRHPAGAGRAPGVGSAARATTNGPTPPGALSASGPQPDIASSA